MYRLSAFFVGEGILPSVAGSIELLDCEARDTAGAWVAAAPIPISEPILCLR
jgi:hypothetical protein